MRNIMRAATYSEQIICKMPPVLIERIKQRARQEGSNMSEFVRTAVRDRLREQETCK